MKLFRLLLCSLLLLPLLAPAVSAQTLDPSFTRATSYAPASVYSVLVDAAGRRVVSGTFSRASGVATSRLVRYDAAGTLDQSFLQNVGVVNEILKVKNAPGNKYLLVGLSNEITAGGAIQKGLSRLNSDGSIDATWTSTTGAELGGTDGFVDDCALQPDGKVVVAGYFDTYNTSPANNLVRLNADGTVDASFNIGFGASDEVYTVLVQPDGKILLGGYFSTFNGQACSGIARLNANGSYDDTFVPTLEAGSVVTDITVQPDGKILLAGNLNPSSTNIGLLRLTATGTVDSGFTPPAFASGSIGNLYFDNNIVLQPDGKILVSGFFSLSAGGPANGVARLNANGTLDASFQVGAGPNGSITGLALQANGTVLVSGYFSAFNGRQSALVQLSSTGALDAAFVPTFQLPGVIYAVARQADGKLLVGGTFTELNGQVAYRLARLNADGTLDAAFSGNTGALPGPVNAIQIQPDGKILLNSSALVLRLNANGSYDNTFTAAFFQGLINALALQADGSLLVGGRLTSLNGTAVYGLVRLRSTGAVDAGFLPGVPTGLGQISVVEDVLVQPDGKIVVAGTYQQGNSTTARVVRYEATGTVDNSFVNTGSYTNTTPASARVYALARQADGKILVGGFFGLYDGNARSSLARLNADGTLDAVFATGTTITGAVYTLAVQPNRRILLGGSFTSSGLPSNLARVLEDGQPDATYARTAVPNSAVQAVLVQPDGGIVLGGNFAAISGQPAMSIARLTAPNVLHVAASAAVAARTQAWPVPAHTTLSLSLDAVARPQSVQLLDNLGRTVLNQPVTQPTLTLPVEQLRAGVYLLRVNYAEGPVTRRVVVE
ncbi:T9SS type A sorting domain-containing protein [Hymenobacter lucidus]|uniref:T9SS type A sorting domain-containing protein n=1 Tax=Hymenobacter lucidus TaxID=2880930 RepID=A0ABS8ASX9_9BACT|nr:T9SS type A sorting domain-containing protein [Hymenobacter lucidus]MCB2409313.1 T9SS type A sorting domain-containing protein [Hymenobacter lucidus]